MNSTSDGDAKTMKPDLALLDATTRVASAALLKHLRRFAQYAGVSAPFGKGFPSAEGGLTNTVAEPSREDHGPGALLDAIVSTADRLAWGLASGESDRVAGRAGETAGVHSRVPDGLVPLFARVGLGIEHPEDAAGDWRYPLRPLSPSSVFPQKRSARGPSAHALTNQDYRHLWEGFTAGLDQIPAAHAAAPDLWIDHFDTLWMTWTQSIPAIEGADPEGDVSLYDHSRVTAALAAALWRWHLACGHAPGDAARALSTRSDHDEPEMLLVQGDFFGIQDFIFSTGAQTQRHAAKLLRGRSFQVSLFSELAALRVLDALSLPSTSLVGNAAGKFLIVAPNSQETREALEALRREFDAWFLEHTFGVAGVGLAWCTAARDDFILEGDGEPPFTSLMTRLRRELELAKYQRFGLAEGMGGALEARFPHGPCAWNGLLPADQPGGDGQPPSCRLSRDQVAIGESLVRGYGCLLVLDADAVGDPRAGHGVRPLETTVLGYRLVFATAEAASGRFGSLAENRVLRRCWDYALPEPGTSQDAVNWAGHARRNIAGHVPRLTADDLAQPERYGAATGDAAPVGELETFDRIACEDKCLEDGHWHGIDALAVLKGDIDDLGELFRVGLRRPTFARHASLSRQVNTFFVTWLPDLLAREFPKVYTVFAGGDDFFLVGPWRTVQRLAVRLREDFARYACGNPRLHFSVGIATQKAGAPVRALAELADDALSRAKAREGKDAVHCFGVTVPWGGWAAIEQAMERLEELRAELRLSTAFVYGLLQFVEMRGRETVDPSAAMWRARLAYRARRMVVDRIRLGDESERARRFVQIAQDIGHQGIERLGLAYRIVLFNHLYRHRNPRGTRRSS